MRHMLLALLLVALLLVALLLVALGGCGNSDTSPDVQAVKPDADTVESTNAATVEPQAISQDISQDISQNGDPIVNSIGMRFVPIPPGTFTMGDANGQVHETPHQVTLTKGFELGVYEVTQEQYEQVMGRKPSEFKGPQNPVENVSWDDAVEFCRNVSGSMGFQGLAPGRV